MSVADQAWDGAAAGWGAATGVGGLVIGAMVGRLLKGCYVAPPPPPIDIDPSLPGYEDLPDAPMPVETVTPAICDVVPFSSFLAGFGEVGLPLAAGAIAAVCVYAGVWYNHFRGNLAEPS